MELTPLTPKSLLPPADSLPVERFRELTNEETALRHRLELKVERALYRAAVGLQEMGDSQSYDSNRPWLARIWGDEQKVEAAFSEATAALRELNKRQLYRSTHSCFRQYLSERFGWSIEEIYPEGC